MTDQARDTEKKCPQCGSRSFRVTYEEVVQSSNRVVDGRWVGVFVESAMPSRKAAYGECTRCEHAWRFRTDYVD